MDSKGRREKKTKQGHGVPTPGHLWACMAAAKTGQTKMGGGQQPGTTNDWFKPLQTCFFFHSPTPVVVQSCYCGPQVSERGTHMRAHHNRRGHRGRGAEERGEGNNSAGGRRFLLAPLSRPNGDGTHRSQDPIGAVNLLASAVDAQPFSIARMHRWIPWDVRDPGLDSSACLCWEPPPAAPRCLFGGEGRVVPCPSCPAHRAPGARMSSRDRDGCPQKPRARQRQG